ncbi:phosphatase [Clostridium chauvoei]|uniref:phosphatase n=1 Tax=Clostridium chauvoei TaxID=46867 RepID=UPI001C85BBFF|nr:phosphatase [Clostridium chauvoei]MBX7333746.1 phosphatase [Clostridium chauvoei]
MNYLSDLHTHTIISGHAYSTLLENVHFCSKKGIKILGTSEHGPNMPGAPHIWYFHNLRVLPRVIEDVIILKGCEANIIDANRNLDIDNYSASKLDYVIASLHEPCFQPKSKDENTNAILKVMDNYKEMEILGHLGNPNYQLDYEKIIKKALEKDIMIEINNSSLLGKSRKGSDVVCKEIALLCKKYGNKVILSSDSHFASYIGKFDLAIEMLNSIDMPKEQIMNNPDKLIFHLKNKGRLLDLNY